MTERNAPSAGCVSYPSAGRRWLLREFVFEDRVDLAGVGFAARFFHYLADKEANQLVLARFIIGNLTGIGGNDPVNNIFDCRRVRYLFEAPRFDDVIGVALASPHRFKHFFGDFARDSAVLNAIEQTCEFSSCDITLLNIQAVFVQCARQVADHSVCCDLRLGGRGRSDSLEVI